MTHKRVGQSVTLGRFNTFKIDKGFIADATLFLGHTFPYVFLCVCRKDYSFWFIFSLSRLRQHSIVSYEAQLQAIKRSVIHEESSTFRIFEGISNSDLAPKVDIKYRRIYGNVCGNIFFYLSFRKGVQIGLTLFSSLLHPCKWLSETASLPLIPTESESISFGIRSCWEIAVNSACV